MSSLCLNYTLTFVGATAGLTVATGKLNSSISWRVPLAIQIIPAAILLFFSFLLPEVSLQRPSLKSPLNTVAIQSPRWLIAVGRQDEARAILAKYHGNDDPDAPLVLLEWKEFEESVKLDASDKRWSVFFLYMKQEISINLS